MENWHSNGSKNSQNGKDSANDQLQEDQKLPVSTVVLQLEDSYVKPSYRQERCCRGYNWNGK